MIETFKKITRANEVTKDVIFLALGQLYKGVPLFQ